MLKYYLSPTDFSKPGNLKKEKELFDLTWWNLNFCTVENWSRNRGSRPRILNRCFRNCWRVESESLDRVEPNTTGQGSDWASSFFGTSRVGHLPSSFEVVARYFQHARGTRVISKMDTRRKNTVAEEEILWIVQTRKSFLLRAWKHCWLNKNQILNGLRPSFIWRGSPLILIFLK